MQDISAICISEKEEEFTINFANTDWKFKKREVSWSRINRILGEVMEIDPTNKGKLKFNVEKYNELILKAILTEAPWKLDDTGKVLKQLNPAFGQLLEEHIPNPSNVFGDEDELDFFGSKSTGSSREKSSRPKTPKQ